MIKKAQIGSVFVYAVSAIIIILVVYFGYRGITTLSKANENSITERFQLHLKADMSKLSLKYGTIAMLSYPVTNNYDKICFVDLTTNETETPIRNTALEQLNTLMFDSVTESGKSNAFLIGGKFIDFDVGKIKVKCAPYVICINNTRGKISFRAEGGGDAVIIPCQ